MFGHSKIATARQLSPLICQAGERLRRKLLASGMP